MPASLSASGPGHWLPDKWGLGRFWRIMSSRENQEKPVWWLMDVTLGVTLSWPLLQVWQVNLANAFCGLVVGSRGASGLTHGFCVSSMEDGVSCQQG